jgi:tRNA(fMet)-specific endonuclease VapC
LEAVLDAFDILPFEEPADRHYEDIRSALERVGTPIGANDMLIAAHALALGLTLVTNNTGEFRRVPGLLVENWLDQ